MGVIGAEAFTNMTNVTKLSLINNKIDRMDQLRLTARNGVKSLHMTGNHLLDVPPLGSALAIGADTAVAARVITNNHFPCDCRVFRLLDSSLADGDGGAARFAADNYCISPASVQGKSIETAIDYSNLAACPDENEVEEEEDDDDDDDDDDDETYDGNLSSQATQSTLTSPASSAATQSFSIHILAFLIVSILQLPSICADE